MMSSLSCFDLGEHMLSVDEARQALLTLVDGQLATESVALAQAHGRVLAKPVTAPFNVPGHTNSAMDGIALSWPEEGVAGSLRRVGSALGRPAFCRAGGKWRVRQYHHRSAAAGWHRHGDHGRATSAARGCGRHPPG